MKNLVISGSIYNGVEQLHFKTAEGGMAVFVDADTRSGREISCGFKSSTKGGAFIANTINTANVTPSVKMTLEV